MAARVLSCAFWLQRLSLLRWFTITMAQHVFACAIHRFLRDGISGLRLPDTAVYPRFSLLRTSREAGGYAYTSAPEGCGLHTHEDVSLSRLNHRLPRGQAHPEVVEGAAEFHHEITDASLPQADAVFHDAAALDTALDMLDAQPTLVERLVRPLLLPRELLAPWLLR